MVLLILLHLALRYGSTRISTTPAGCLFPDVQPPDGELTAATAAALYTQHRHCFQCPIQRLAADVLDDADAETYTKPAAPPPRGVGLRSSLGPHGYTPLPA